MQPTDIGWLSIGAPRRCSSWLRVPGRLRHADGGVLRLYRHRRGRGGAGRGRADGARLAGQVRADRRAPVHPDGASRPPCGLRRGHLHHRAALAGPLARRGGPRHHRRRGFVRRRVGFGHRRLRHGEQGDDTRNAGARRRPAPRLRQRRRGGDARHHDPAQHPDDHLRDRHRTVDRPSADRRHPSGLRHRADLHGDGLPQGAARPHALSQAGEGELEGAADRGQGRGRHRRARFRSHRRDLHRLVHADRGGRFRRLCRLPARAGYAAADLEPAARQPARDRQDDRHGLFHRRFRLRLRHVSRHHAAADQYLRADRQRGRQPLRDPDSHSRLLYRARDASSTRCRA